MHNHSTPTPNDHPNAGGSGWSGRAQCQVCQARDGQGIIGGLLVCGACYADAKDDTIRLWRASLRLVEGGYPR